MAANIMMPKRGRPCRTKLMEWSAIPLRKRLEVVFLAQVIKDRKVLSRRLDLPLGVIDKVLSYKHNIILDWKHSPFNNASLSTAQLESIAAVNEVVAEWRLRLLALDCNVSDAMLRLKAAAVVTACKAEQFQMTRIWLAKLKMNTHRAVMDPTGSGSLHLCRIIRDLKTLMPHRIYSSFLTNAELSTAYDPQLDATPDPFDTWGVPGTSSQCANANGAGHSSDDSDVEIIDMPVDLIDMTGDDELPPEFAYFNEPWDSSESFASPPRDKLTPKAKAKKRRRTEETEDPGPPTAPQPEDKPEMTPCHEESPLAMPLPVESIKVEPCGSEAVPEASVPSVKTEPSPPEEPCCSTSQRPRSSEPVEVLAIVGSDGCKVEVRPSMGDTLDAVTFVKVLSHDVEVVEAEAEEQLDGDLMALMQAEFSNSQRSEEQLLPLERLDDDGGDGHRGSLRRTHQVARKCLLKLAEYLTNRLDLIGAAEVTKLAATFAPAPM